MPCTECVLRARAAGEREHTKAHANNGWLSLGKPRAGARGNGARGNGARGNDRLILRDARELVRSIAAATIGAYILLARIGLQPCTHDFSLTLDRA